MSDEIHAVCSAIHHARRILCVSHLGPDGDAVGCLLGMGLILRQLHKQPILALPDAVPDEYLFLPGIDAVVGPNQVPIDLDLIICLDASSPDRMGQVYRPAHHVVPLVVVDHHVTNTRFGRVNWVAPDYAATCQMLVHLADALDVPIDGFLAQALLTGLVTDTLGFRTSNTDVAVLDTASRLMRAGANLADIIARTLNRRRYNMVRLWAEVLPSTELADGVIWLTVTREQLRSTGIANGDLQLSSFLITTVEADISATFLEKDDEKGRPAVECSFRSKPGYDVSQIALELGGGGHPAASGCTLTGSLEEVSARVVPLLQAIRSAQSADQKDRPD